LGEEKEAIMDLLGMFKPNVSRMQKAKDVDGLVRALRHSDIHIRSGAESALIALSDPRAVEPLIALVLTENPDGLALVAAWIAAKILGEMKEPKAVNALVRMLARAPNNRAAYGPEAAAAKSLGQIGDPRAVDSLITALNSSKEEIVTAALEALTTLKGRLNSGTFASECRKIDAAIAKNDSVRRTIHAYATELVSIGLRIGFLRGSWEHIGVPDPGDALFAEDYNKRTREIGTHLYELGGIDLMTMVWREVARLAPSEGRILEAAWHGIGLWRG
jgi:hypothetical protein